MSRSSHLPRFLGSALLTSTLVFAPGCLDFLEQFEDSGGVVNVFAGHIESQGEDGESTDKSPDAIQIQTDDGWTVLVTDLVITTTGGTLHSCNGDDHEVEMYWGALPESMRHPDNEVTGLGGVNIPEGDYCSATVEYGPFTPSTEGHGAPTPRADGNTFYMKGLASRDGVDVPFEVTVAAAYSIEADLAAPLHMSHNPVRPPSLTIFKTYDRFFDGVDFESMDQMSWETHLEGVLMAETIAVNGTHPTD